MKLNKRLMGLVVVAALSASVVGCSSSTTNDTEDTQIETPVEDEEEIEEDEEEEELETEIDEEDEEAEEEEIEIGEVEEEVEEEKPVTPPAEEKPPVEEDKPQEQPPVEEDKPEEQPPVEEEPPVDETPDAPAMSASEVYGKTMSGIELGGMTMPIDDMMLADTYGIDTSLLKSYHVEAPMIVITANEVAVFEVADEAYVDAVVAGINRRVESLKATWESYLVEQYELVVNHKVAVKGNYVLFVVDENADAVVNNFNNAF